MDQQRIERVADAWTLHLGVADDRYSLVEVGGLIDVQLADANPPGDHWGGSVFAAELVQRCAIARDDHVYLAVERQQLPYQRAIGVVDRVVSVPRSARLNLRA